MSWDPWVQIYAIVGMVAIFVSFYLLNDFICSNEEPGYLKMPDKLKVWHIIVVPVLLLLMAGNVIIATLLYAVFKGIVMSFKALRRFGNITIWQKKVNG